jgi:hypothetical protein
MSDSGEDLEGMAMSGFVDVLSATILMFMFFVLITAVALFFHVLTFISKEVPVSEAEILEVKQLVVVLEEENQELREQVSGLNQKAMEIDANFAESNADQKFFISPDGMTFAVFFGANSITITEPVSNAIKAFMEKGIATHGPSLTAAMTAPKTKSNIDSVARKVAIARLLNARNSLLGTTLARESILLEVKPPEELDGDSNWTMIQLKKR